MSTRRTASPSTAGGPPAGPPATGPRPPVPFWIQSLIIVIVTVAAHSSSLGNRYALDDQLIILRNVPVQRGIAGIPEIFRTHIYASYFEWMNADAPPANRHYRPLAVAPFAIEQSLFGRTLGDRVRAEPEAQRAELTREVDRANDEIAFPRHVIQVLLYAGSMIVLLLFLSRCIFPAMPMAAFIATLLFALHPVHTEVVANLKSRDEILSLLFILTTGVFVFEWDRTRKRAMLVLSLVSMLLALFSKEYAVVAPFMFAAALMLVRGRSLRDVLRSTVLPLMIPIALFMIVRQQVLAAAGPDDHAPLDVIVDPFAKIRSGEADGSIAATKIAIVDEYLRLLVVPHPLSADYSYATFPYRTFASWQVWLSLLLHAALLALTLWAWRRRHILAFAGIVYFGFLVLVQIGATLGERLVYHSSLGFALLLGYAIAKLPRYAAAAVALAIAIPYGAATYARDSVWFNDRTLFVHDVKTVPNSTLANAKAGSAILNEALDLVSERGRRNQPLTPADRELVRRRAAEALVYLNRAVRIHDRYYGAWISAGTAHYYREEWEESAMAFARAAAISPGSPALRQYARNFQLLGSTLAKSGDIAGAMAMFRRAAGAAPEDVQYQFPYAAAAFAQLRFAEAREAFAKAIEADPSSVQAQQGYAAAKVYDELTKATVEHPGDPAAFDALAAALARNPQPAFAAAAERARASAARLRSAAAAKARAN